MRTRPPGRAGTISSVNIDALFPAASGDTDESVLGLTELSYTQFLSRNFAIFGGFFYTLDGDDNPIAGNGRRNEIFLNAAFPASPVEVTTGPTVTLGGGAKSADGSGPALSRAAHSVTVA